MKSNFLKYFVIGTFVALYLVVSIISTIHVVQFFDLTNPKWLSVSLAVAFEIGAAASLASLIALDKMNKFLVWSLFIVLTCMQAMGNTYYAYINIQDFAQWSELFGLSEDDIIYQKRILSIISGAILPLVALGFIKSLVDYIKPEEEKVEEPVVLTEQEEKLNQEDILKNNNESEDPGNIEVYDESDSFLQKEGDEPTYQESPVDEEFLDDSESKDSDQDDTPNSINTQEENKHQEESGTDTVIDTAVIENANSNSRFSLRRPPYFS